MLFLKRCSDVFDQRCEEIVRQQGQAGKSPAEAARIAEMKSWYGASFYVPPESRWRSLLDHAHHNVGDYLNKALAGLEAHSNSRSK
jgi:type I restriction enzyme M protein